MDKILKRIEEKRDELKAESSDVHLIMSQEAWGVHSEFCEFLNELIDAMEGRV